MRIFVLSALMMAVAVPAMADTHKGHHDGRHKTRHEGHHKAGQQARRQGGQQAMTHTAYSCEGGKNTLDVVYFSTGTGDDYAVVLEQGALLPMKQTISASGAAYRPVNPNYHYELATKGSEATLFATTDGKEEAVKSDCNASN